MKDIFYFGASLKATLAEAFCNAGHTLIHLPHAQGLHELEGGAPTCGAVLLEWRSKRDQRVIVQAKTLHIPVLVITAKLVSAVKAGPPAADMYLEKPSPDHEVVANMLDMMTAQPAERTVAAAAAGCAVVENTAQES